MYFNMSITSCITKFRHVIHYKYIKIINEVYLSELNSITKDLIKLKYLIIKSSGACLFQSFMST